MRNRQDASRWVQGGRQRWYGVLIAPLFLVILNSVEIPSSLDTFGPYAERLESVWWLMLGLAVPIYLATMALLVVAIVRSRQRDEVIDPREVRYSSLLVGGGVIVPALVIVPFVVITVLVGGDLTAGGDDENLEIEVIGHQWWWEIRYPETGAVTANQMHIPVDRHVEVRLEAEDVIHSIWVPQLQGKLDLIPGKTNMWQIEANETGTLRGQCAEFCGVQHTNMRFLVVVQEQDEFDQWLENQSQTADEPVQDLASQGQDVFQSAGCASCHQVRGVTEAEREDIIAPDLTHLASRQEIAAGALENTPDNLAAWFLGPQEIKPGARMPATDLDSEQIDALLAYLESLE